MQLTSKSASVNLATVVTVDCIHRTVNASHPV